MTIWRTESGAGGMHSDSCPAAGHLSLSARCLLPSAPFDDVRCRRLLSDVSVWATFSQTDFRSNAQTVNFFKRLSPSGSSWAEQVKCQLDFRGEKVIVPPALLSLRCTIAIACHRSCQPEISVSSPDCLSACAVGLCLKHLKYCHEIRPLLPQHQLRLPLCLLSPTADPA